MVLKEHDSRLAASTRRMIRASLAAPVSTLGLSGFSRRRAIKDARSAGDNVGSDRSTDFNTSRVEGSIDDNHV